MAIIEVNDLTKDYGNGRGVFDVNIKIEKGEVFGYLGPNGAGKTTTIRHIMGFSKPQIGSTKVNGLNCWNESSKILPNIGYLPGEIALPDGLTGNEFLDMMAKLRNVTNMDRTKYLLEKFKLDPSGSLKRMSLGNKRKLAIVTAFMHDPDILVLDEPTSGLDPIMQGKFIEFILEEKKRGKTILLSSHIFSEIDATCDRIAIIKDGRIVSVIHADTLKHNESKTYKIEFIDSISYELFLSETPFEILNLKPKYYQLKILLNDKDINKFFTIISKYSLKYISEIKFTLEDYFMDFYDRKKTVEEGLAHVINQNK